MANKKNTRRALFMSVISLILCCAMLMGTTFAWFTDSATSANNIIKSGNLDVKMYWADGKDDPNGETTEWTDASEGPIFNYEKWEPGYAEVYHIKIANEGNLALKYQFNIIANGVVSDLADVIDVYYVDPAVQVANRDSLANVAKLGTLTEVLAGISTSASGNLLAEGSHTITLALKMQESAGNQYQDIAIGSTFSVQLLATQLTSEYDSFDNQYDKLVASANELRNSLEEGQGGNIVVNGEMNVDGTVDVPTWTNAPAEYVIDATWVNSLSGGTYTLDEGSKYGIVARVSDGESLSLSDMDVTANSQWPMYLANFGGEITVSDVTINAESGAGIYPYGTNGTTILNDVKVNQERLDPEYASSTPWAGTAVACSNGHHLVINSGIYVGSSWAVYGYNSGSTITINGGTFKAPTVIQLDGVWSGTNTSVATINGGNFDGAIYLDWGTNVPELYIKGGNFISFSATVNGQAKLVITGGTFDADPSAYVAAGYIATENSGVWTVTAV